MWRDAPSFNVMPDAHQHFDRDSGAAVLSRMETKLDLLLEEQREQDRRITALEQFRWWLVGAMGLGGVGGGVIVSRILGGG